MGKQHPNTPSFTRCRGALAEPARGRQDELRPSSPDRDVNEAARNEGMKAPRGVGPLGINSIYGRASKKMDS
jgi:hypothetical protein